MDILIFWGLSMVRWKKWCFSGLCQNSTAALYYKGWEPDTPQTHPNFHEYHWDILWTPPGTTQDTSQTSQGNKWWRQMTTDANRHKQPAPDTPRHWEVLFEYVWRCLLASVGVSCFMEISWGMSGVSEWCLWGIGGYLGGINGNWMCSGVFWVLSPCSMEP